MVEPGFEPDLTSVCQWLPIRTDQDSLEKHILNIFYIKCLGPGTFWISDVLFCLVLEIKCKASHMLFFSIFVLNSWYRVMAVEWGVGLVAEHLPSLCEALDSIPSTENKTKPNQVNEWLHTSDLGCIPEEELPFPSRYHHVKQKTTEFLHALEERELHTPLFSSFSVLLCITAWPETHDLPATASWVLGLWAFTTTPSCHECIFITHFIIRF
jgi:hypothetical protein